MLAACSPGASPQAEESEEPLRDDKSPAQLLAVADADSSQPLPASSPPSVRASSGGGVSCSFIDPTTRAYLSEALLLAVAHAAVLDTHAKPFASAADAAASLFAELRVSLVESVPRHDAVASLQTLHASINTFVESKRTWLTRAPLASEQSLREKALQLRGSLLAQSGALVHEAEVLTPSLVILYDRKLLAHCGQRCSEAESLATHKQSCPFRPTPCANPGCFEALSAQRLAEHDAVCAYKPQPCVRGCPERVRRLDMAAHCATSCANRPVGCPFARLGCKEAVTQGNLDLHLTSETACHLGLLLGATVQCGEEVGALARTVMELQSSAASERALGVKAAAAAAAALTAATEKAEKAEREAREARKEAREARDEARRARDEAKSATSAAGKATQDVKELAAWRAITEKTLAALTGNKR